MKFIGSLLFICLVFSCFSQKGDFLLTDHSPRAAGLDNTSFEIISDLNGRLCIANRSGVLKYDGESWDFFKTPSSALSLAVDSANIIYTGCIGSIGKIDFTERKITYQPLLDKGIEDDFFLETIFYNQKVYFLGNNHLVIYAIEDQQIEIIEGDYSNIFLLGNELFVNQVDGTTFRMEEALVPVELPHLIAYASQQQDGIQLLIDFEGLIYRHENDRFKKLPQNEIVAEEAVEVRDIEWINDSLFVCSTVQNGVYFFNQKDTDYFVVSDFKSGLPDNEIFAMQTDKSNSVWVAHPFGITNISPLFPANSYAHFPGLEGIPTNVQSIQNDLWVTTSLGLFYFDRDTIFQNRVYYDVIEEEKSNPIQILKNKATAKPKKEDKTEKKKKNGLSRLLSKVKRAKSTKNDSTQEEKKTKGLLAKITDKINQSEKLNVIKGKLSKSKKYVRRVRKIPTGFTYQFQKVKDANSKFINVLPFGKRYLGISTSGIYEIEKGSATLVIEENLRAFDITKSGKLLISTQEMEVKLFEQVDNIWTEQYEADIQDIIVSINHDNNDNLWLAGSSAVYKTVTSDTSLRISDVYFLENNFLDEVNILATDNDLYFVNSSNIYHIDTELDSIVEYKEIKEEIGQIRKHLQDQYSGSIWIFNGSIWYKIGTDGNVTPYEYLALFPDLRSIVESESENVFWLLTSENDLLKFDPSKEGIIEDYRFFARKVSNDLGDINSKKKFTLGYDENFLRVELSKPDFHGLLKPQFQYKMVGLNDEWSEWSDSKSIDFSFLPEGSYALEVRSKDAFGRMEESQVLAFKVKPPYWQTLWFYALQIIFFGALVIYSSKLNQDDTKNQFLSEGLTILTLILIIEFLQTAIGSLFEFKSTPVVDFAIDALIALMIFPLERLLREILTKGKVKIPAQKKKLTPAE